ncbi:hypothetical protein F5890DRAFT_1479654 [Lentinula detonsa]|uniref:Uncharacterized protein n=1 Tax=Lentinula detonsa TaxID=2804962 RepID=A0AA38Q9Y5_9AGAR|nr:hypothetical protein F5890DRAFT_1479654 [Lentinula detonsa]
MLVISWFVVTFLRLSIFRFFVVVSDSYSCWGFVITFCEVERPIRGYKSSRRLSPCGRLCLHYRIADLCLPTSNRIPLSEGIFCQLMGVV